MNSFPFLWILTSWIVWVGISTNTTYGVFKSLYEFTCVGSREEPATYSNAQSYVSSIEIKGFLFLDLYQSEKEDSCLFDVTDSSGSLVERGCSSYYKKSLEGGSYFRYSFASYPTTFTPEGNITLKRMNVGDGGFVTVYNTETPVKKGGCSFTTDIRVNPRTCSLPKKFTDFFALTFLSFCLCSLIIALVINLPFKDHIIKRVFRKILFSESEHKELRFCNEVTGEYNYSLKGTVISFLCETEGLFDFQEMENFIFYGGSVQCFQNSVRINSGRISKVYDLGDKISNFKRYLNCVFLDPNRCCVNSNLNHFLSFSEVAEEMVKGKFLSELGLFETIFVSGEVEISWTLYNYLNKALNYSKSMISDLSAHNKIFFSNNGSTGNEGVLLQVCRKKTECFMRNSSCKNSQWKKYVSDCSKIFEKYSIPFKNVVKMNSSPSLKRALSEPNTIKIREEVKLIIRSSNESDKTDGNLEPGTGKTFEKMGVVKEVLEVQDSKISYDSSGCLDLSLISNLGRDYKKKIGEFSKKSMERTGLKVKSYCESLENAEKDYSEGYRKALEGLSLVDSQSKEPEIPVYRKRKWSSYSKKDMNLWNSDKQYYAMFNKMEEELKGTNCENLSWEEYSLRLKQQEERKKEQVGLRGRGAVMNKEKEEILKLNNSIKRNLVELKNRFSILEGFTKSFSELNEECKGELNKEGQSVRVYTLSKNEIKECVDCSINSIKCFKKRVKKSSLKSYNKFYSKLMNSTNLDFQILSSKIKLKIKPLGLRAFNELNDEKLSCLSDIKKTSKTINLSLGEKKELTFYKDVYKVYKKNNDSDDYKDSDENNDDDIRNEKEDENDIFDEVYTGIKNMLLEIDRISEIYKKYEKIG